LDYDGLGHRPPIAPPDLSISHFDTRNVRTDLHYNAHNFTPGRKGARRLELILVFDDQRIRKVNSASLDGQEDLTAVRLGRVHLLKQWRVRTAGKLAKERLHLFLRSLARDAVNSRG